MSTDGVLGAAYLPTDGYIDPSQLTFALAEGARRGGAETRAERLIAELGGEVILSQREISEPGTGAIDTGSAALGGLSAGLSTTQ